MPTCRYQKKGLKDQYCMSRVATVREKVWKMKFFPGQGKIREFGYESGKFRKNAKSQGKVREFQIEECIME